MAGDASSGLHHRDRADCFACAGLFTATLLLYILTLAPTVTWGDDATLQLAAVRGDLHASAGSHPAWTALAHILSGLPVSEPAYGVNLTSALGAAATLALLFLVMRRLRISLTASLIASAAFAVSHTFWAHAVRAEVYTLTLATMTLPVWIALLWRDTGHRGLPALLGAALGLALSTHVLALLYLPALAWLTLRQRRMGPRDAALLLASASLSLFPLGCLLWRDARTLDLSLVEALRWALFTFQGYDFSDQMLRLSPGWLQQLRDWAIYLAYQFAGAGLVFAVLGLWRSFRKLPKTESIFLALLYLVPTLFAFTYPVGDQYVFYLPGYLPVAIWLGIGIDDAQRWLASRASKRAAGAAALALLIVGGPVGVYRLMPELVQRFDLQFRESRYVPGPQGRYFTMWPPKTNYYDARQFSEDMLAAAPDDALLLADPILASPMSYLQAVEGRRSDVKIRFCCWDIEENLATAEGRPIALADIAPAIYPIERLEREFTIVSSGVLYLLVEPVPAGTE